jgi:hypothetical protein
MKSVSTFLCARFACAQFLVLLAVLALPVPYHSLANTYAINRSFTDGDVATLIGTVDIPQGNYTIMNAAASPFTAVDLILTVNNVSHPLNYALTDIILGTGRFFINAGPTSLIFNTANADGLNPADLVFSASLNPLAAPRYVIGYNGFPGFEVAYTPSGDVNTGIALPVVFGTLVPEPGLSALLLLAFGIGGFQYRRNRSSSPGPDSQNYQN